MPESEGLLEFANQLYAAHTGSALSEVLQHLLAETLSTGSKPKSYSQIGAETGYSGAYLKNAAARDLWAVFSKILGTKVTRQNIRTLLLEQVSRHDVSSPPIPALEQGADTELDAEGSTHPDPDVLNARSTSVPWVLVVDDQPHNLKVLTDLLQQEEYNVWTAGNGAEALKKAGMLLPDLILLDVNMPGMNGYEVCRQLKADPRTQLIPVIFVSALNESWDKVQAFSVGGADYITKPFNTIETLVRIDHQIQIKATQTEVSSLETPAADDGPASPQYGSMDESAAIKATIMVVDDEPENLSFFAHLLKEEGYAVWQAKTGAEALKFAPKVVPDLILLDINLPDMKGYDACLQLRANDQTKRIPVIFISALDTALNKVKGFAVGGNDYITKPVKVLELHCRIQSQLRLQRLRSQLNPPESP